MAIRYCGKEHQRGLVLSRAVLYFADLQSFSAKKIQKERTVDDNGLCLHYRYTINIITAARKPLVCDYRMSSAHVRHVMFVAHHAAAIDEPETSNVVTVKLCESVDYTMASVS